MNWFLDMCIIIYYSSKGESIFYKKSLAFIEKHKGEKFLICKYITSNDMPKWIKRQRVIVDEAVKKIKDQSYDFETSEGWKLLYSKDKATVEKLVLASKFNSNKEEYIKLIINSQKEIELEINRVVGTLCEEVLPIEEIDFDLKSSIYTFTKNHSDSNILASGIQLHQKRDIKIMTGDKKDWNENNLSWVFESRPDLAKKYPKIPKINYI
jgi:hypothetical protein